MLGEPKLAYEQVRMAVAALRLDIANETAKNNSYDARENTKTLTDDVLADLKETSGKATGWTVTATPAANTVANTYAAKETKTADEVKKYGVSGRTIGQAKNRMRKKKRIRQKKQRQKSWMPSMTPLILW